MNLLCEYGQVVTKSKLTTAKSVKTFHSLAANQLLEKIKGQKASSPEISSLASQNEALKAEITALRAENVALRTAITALDCM